MAYTLQQAGVLVGLLLLVVMGIITDYSLIILSRSSRISGTSSYQGVMNAAFGTTGYVIISILQFIYPFIGNHNPYQSSMCVICFMYGWSRIGYPIRNSIVLSDLSPNPMRHLFTCVNNIYLYYIILYNLLQFQYFFFFKFNLHPEGCIIKN